MSTKANMPVTKPRLPVRIFTDDEAKDVWARVLRGAPRDGVSDMVEKFNAKGTSPVAMGELLRKTIGMSQPERKRLEFMVEKRFAPEQIHLFAYSTPEDRQDLASAWQRGTVDRVKEAISKTPSAFGMANNFALVGASAGCLLVIAAGVAELALTGKPDILQSGVMTLDWALNARPVVDENGPHMSTTFDQIIENGAGLSTATAFLSLCAKAGLNGLQELLKDDPAEAVKKAKKSLNASIIVEFDRTKGEAFETPNGAFSRDEVTRELETMPSSYLPIFTHFTSGEQVAFLVADNDGRETMLRTNPPTQGQKEDTVRALHSGKMRRAWETARQSLIAWDGALSSDKAGVTLASSFGALLDARHQAKKLLAPDEPMANPSIR